MIISVSVIKGEITLKFFEKLVRGDSLDLSGRTWKEAGRKLPTVV